MVDGVFSHFLNGVSINEPRGFKEFTDSLERDFKERIIGSKYKASLTFVGSGFEYLNDLSVNEGNCATAFYEARQWCGGVQYTVIQGEVILSECSFNETRCEAEVAIADNAIGARVINNNEIPISPTANKTKNGEDLQALTRVDLEVFDPDDVEEDYLPMVRPSWDWYDAIRHAVLYITDNECSVVSDWYEALPDNENYCIAYGYNLRTGSDKQIVWNFKLLFFELAKKYNLWIGVEKDSSGNPVLRIEPESYFYSTDGTIDHTNIQDLVRSCDLERLWAKVDVGSDIFEKEFGTTFSLPFLVLRGHSKEQFHFSGKCNTNATLDLVNEWVIDTNVIEDVVVNNNDEHDDEIFLIQYTKSTEQATKSPYLNAPIEPFLYNEQFQNGLVLGRYDLPSSVGSNYSVQTESFQALRTEPGTTDTFNGNNGSSALQIFQFDNDYTAPNFDPSNSWGNGTPQGLPVSQANSRFTTSTQGFFEFEVLIRWAITQNIPITVGGPTPLTFYKSVQLTAVAERYDSANTLIDSIAVNSTIEYIPGIRQFTFFPAFSLNVGDYVQIQYGFTHFNYAYQLPFAQAPGGTPGISVRPEFNSGIRTNFVTGGGFVAGGGEARIIKYEYERHIDAATWVDLTADPKQSIGIGGGEQVTSRTHVLTAERNVVTGKTTWAMIKRP